LTAGQEELLLIDDLTRATYTYGGQGGSILDGGSATAYVGLAVNVENPEDFQGHTASVGMTISILHGGTISYFWDSRSGPFSPGTVKGITAGYSPGAQASIWWSSTLYDLTWRSDR
jgi:hypothetical protein